LLSPAVSVVLDLMQAPARDIFLTVLKVVRRDGSPDCVVNHGDDTAHPA
jgi:hypothetical protein